ncbi:MAG: cob(I)yrinic acid a,c-diamide adenosyltransferase [Lachnospiraceae bacterium]|nr:cob(I)yrinic acid a,c-diamide adenosyltransferase [Lachnospiraceae bacterium]
MKGLVHIYHGYGKGKTTAAIGLAVRAAGNDIPVVVVRFLKTDRSGELAVLEKISQIHLIPTEKNFKFAFCMSDEEKAEAGRLCTKMLESAFDKAYALAAGGKTLLVMDEVLDAVNCGFVEKQRLIRLLNERPEGLEVVMTGRNPAAEQVELADYVTEMKKEKHPYDQGIMARKGIEF